MPAFQAGTLPRTQAEVNVETALAEVLLDSLDILKKRKNLCYRTQGVRFACARQSQRRHEQEFAAKRVEVHLGKWHQDGRCR